MALTFYNAAQDLVERNILAGRGNRIVYTDERTSITFADLDTRTQRFASALPLVGVHREQRVFICANDTVDWPVVFLGCIRAGVVPVAANTLLTESDYEYMLRDSRAVLAIVSPEFLDLFHSIQQRVPSLKRIVSVGPDSPQGQDTIEHIIEHGYTDYGCADTTRDEPCFWLYSSGSTGKPKGTVHAHGSMIETAELFAQKVLGLTEYDRIFSAAKLFFAYGLGNALSFPLSVGASVVLLGSRPTPEAVFDILTKQLPTVFCGVPTLYARMLADERMPDRDKLMLRVSTSAGEALPEELLSRWEEKLGSTIVDGIGSTEMLHIYLSNSPNNVKPGTTGRPVPGYEVKLLNSQGNEVPWGEIGDLYVKGPSSAIGYWNKLAKSRETFQGEWTRTGDKFWVNPEGYYVYAGRSDDMLKVSGIYVSPAEVEAALIKHPSVLEAAVIGAKDENNLMKPKAYVVLQQAIEPTETLSQDLKHFVKQHLAPHSYPRWFVYVDELPKTATGKIQRFKLREMEK